MSRSPIPPHTQAGVDYLAVSGPPVVRAQPTETNQPAEVTLPPTRTQRRDAKEARRQSLLAAAASQFAARGFGGVSLEELGAAAGVSGPAVYRHFPGKQAVLAALLVSVSEELLAGGQQVAARNSAPLTALQQLVSFHVDFALSNPDVIRVQDRDLTNLAEPDQSAVRALQRSYVHVWVEILAQLHPSADPAELRLRAHATFGLINSTPHSVRSLGRKVPMKTARPLLEAMAQAALTAP